MPPRLALASPDIAAARLSADSGERSVSHVWPCRLQMPPTLVEPVTSE